MMASDREKRNSSFELLRIICMLLIVAHHYFVHGNFANPTYTGLSVEYVFLQIFSMFGRPACTIFAMITGFFMIDSSGKNHYRKLVPIIAQMFFYAILIVAIVCPLGVREFSLESILKGLVPIVWGNWYVKYYCVFYLFIPFINKWLKQMDKAQFKSLLIIAIIVWSIIPTVTGNEWSFGELIFFFVSYALGAYIKLHVHGKVEYKNSRNLLVALGAVALMAILTVACDLLAIAFKENALIDGVGYLREYNIIPSLIFSVALFLYFSNKQFSSKTINMLASTTMGIYLIHDNDIFRPVLWNVLVPPPASGILLVVHALVKVIVVFVVCALIDWLRAITVGKWFEKWFYYMCAKHDEKRQTDQVKQE